MHPLEETLAAPEAANLDHALEIMRRLPSPLSDLDLAALTKWARKQRAERLVKQN